MNTEDLDKLSRDFEAESELRDTLRREVLELDRKSRSATGIMNRIHSTLDVKPLIESSSSIVKGCHEEFAKIAQVVPPNQFWRWKDMWTRSLQNIIFVAALDEYLSTERLLTLPECEQILGVSIEWRGRFQIPSEDYLHGVIALVNELSRLAVNAVTLGDFNRPVQISVFVRDLYSGFSLLNLKNDSLRRRFDSLKYDMKKIEEVLYDVSLRKLVPPDDIPQAQS
ncbi:recombination hotspot-binding protein (translin), related protein [Rhizoctonia solani 123E]|uniref:Recombination hotspot-binding protein (Translin), related protein n=1 Tax=Rhizoctonia solani 123E TaxID=1423351 RepID=A0A074RRV5_9AGAM|nr:recombination hotspot-binding protein (translin), related protein [Rhizoctonia solani 123E]